jgi:hypothetical protein
MASALNVLQTSHAYGDVMLVSKASEVTKVRTSEYQLPNCSNYIIKH